MKKEIIITRVLNAPVETVWKVFVEPELVKLWWGPENFSCPLAKMDFRLGGTSLVAMRPPKEFADIDFYNIWTYTEIVTNERIEYIQNLSDEAGNLINPINVGMPSDFPKDTETIVTFKDLGAGKTEMTFKEYSDFGQMFDQAKLGLEQCIEKIAKIFSGREKKESHSLLPTVK